MPRLIGSSEKNAIFEINRLGLKVRYIRNEYSEHFPDGVVINQSIPIGNEVKLGEYIDLIISMGRLPDHFLRRIFHKPSVIHFRQILHHRVWIYSNHH